MDDTPKPRRRLWPFLVGAIATMAVAFAAGGASAADNAPSPGAQTSGAELVQDQPRPDEDCPFKDGESGGGQAQPDASQS
jgi:hypothetical protein